MLKNPFPIVALLCALLCTSAAYAAPQSSPDNSLAAALAARLMLMKEVAAWKWVNQHPIADPTQEQAVIDDAILTGLRFGLTAESISDFLRIQIEIAKAIQQHWFLMWQQGERVPTAPDLRAEIRPQLIVLGQRIISLWADHKIPMSEADLRAALTEIAGLSGDDVTELLGAINARSFYPNRLEQIQRSGVIRIGTTGDYAPFSYLDQEQHRIGFDIDVAERLARHLGARIVWISTTWPSLMADFANNLFDIGMSGISITPERQAVAVFSQPYHRGGKAVIARCEVAERFNSLDAIDHPGVRVIVNPGGTNEAFVRDHLKQAEIIRHQDNRTIFKALTRNEADLMITDLIEVRLQSARHRALCPAILKPLNAQDKAIMMVVDPELNKSVDSWLNTQLNNGTLTQMMDAHIRRHQ